MAAADSRQKARALHHCTEHRGRQQERRRKTVCAQNIYIGTS